MRLAEQEAYKTRPIPRSQTNPLAQGSAVGGGRFTIVRRIGAGGMGVVYEAVDHEREETVALKTIQRMSADRILDFKNEFRFLANLAHPNLVRLDELLCINDQWFFTMELVRGVDFLAFVRPSLSPTSAAILAPATGPRRDMPTVAAAPGARRVAAGLSSAASPSTISAGAQKPWAGMATRPMPPHHGHDGPGGPDNNDENDEDGGEDDADASGGTDTVTAAERLTPVDERLAPGLGPALATRANWDKSTRATPKRYMSPVLGAPSAESTRLEETRLRSVLAQLAAGLRALHSAGIVHRDIKPSNVLVDHTGRVVILDFGLATPRRARTSARVAGTPMFMAPEQAAGMPTGPAADWYAMGVMLYLALTGQTPFDGDSHALLTKKQYMDAPAPSDLLGNVPADLDELCIELLRRNPDERPQGQEIVRRLGGNERTGSFTQLMSPRVFVSRRAELRTLHEAFDEAHDELITVFLSGRSGVGKSSLIHQFMRQLERDTAALVLQGRCYERESVPYKAFDEAIDDLTSRLTALPRSLIASLLPADAPIIGRAFPVFRKVLDAVGMGEDSPERDIPDPQQRRAALFSVLRALMANLAAYRPVLLVLDDLQWADDDSLAMLAELTRPPGGPPIMVLCTLRAGDETAVGRTEEELMRSLSCHVRRLALEPLSEAAATELAYRVLYDADYHPDAAAEVAEGIARESQGLPFFVELLARYCAESGELGPLTSPGRNEPSLGRKSLSLGNVLRARIDLLDSQSRRTLAAVCLAGQPTPMAVFARALGMDGGELLRHVSKLRSGQMVVTNGALLSDWVDCFHDRIRTALLASLEPDQVKALHRALATALIAGAEAEPEVKQQTKPQAKPEAKQQIKPEAKPQVKIDSERLAMHYLGAGERAEAARYAEAAARDAASFLAFDRAARLYKMTIELGDHTGPRRVALLAELGEALANAGRGAEAAEVFLQIAPEFPRSQALGYRQRAAKQLLTSGRVQAGLDVLRSLLSEVGIPYPKSLLSALVRLFVRRVKLRLRGLRPAPRPALPLPPEVQNVLDSTFSASIGLAMVDNIRGAYFQARCLELALEVGDIEQVAKSLAMEASFLSAGGHRTLARTDLVLSRARALADELNTPHASAMVSIAEGTTAFMTGRWQEAQGHFERAAIILRERCIGVTWELTTVQRFLCWNLWHLGRILEQDHLLPLYMAEADARGDIYALTSFAANVRFSDDAISRERRKVLRLQSDWACSRHYLPNHQFVYDLASIELYEGDGVAAWERLRRGWQPLKASMMLQVEIVRILFHDLRGRAAIGALVHSREQRRRLMRSATRDIRVLMREASPWAKAQGQLLTAGLLAAKGERDAATTAYEVAERAFTEQGMQLWAAAARDRRGALLGDPAGQGLRAEARRLFREQGVANPDRLLAMLAPGDWPDTNHDL